MSGTLSGKRLLVMAGGTGGHIFPALAVATALRDQGATVHWLGAAGGMERSVAEENGIPFFGIQVGGIRGKGARTILVAPFRLMAALFGALRVIRKLHSDLVLGFGGFASGPGGLAAWMCRVPLVIHEQNSVAGMTNRLLYPLAKRRLTAFPSAFGRKPALLTGNPLRASFLAERPKESVISRKRRLLVLGGSLGAAVLNRTVPEAIAQLPERVRPEVIHQCGKHKQEDCIKAYEVHGVNAQVVSFIEDMRSAYDWADLVICRAGAMTIAELAVTGTPAILIPYPYAVDDHQTFNARYLSERGAARLIPEEALNAPGLATEIEHILNDEETRLNMAGKSRECALPNATQQVVQVCEELLSGEQ